MIQVYSNELVLAEKAALNAGELLRNEYNRLGGPECTDIDHALVDERAEALIRDLIVQNFSKDGILGEELGRTKGCSERVWIIDPNDGTRAYLQGHRGSAVSIALFDNGNPVLGVIYAFGYPDDNGDLISWSQGGELKRNGHKVERPAPKELSSASTVFVSQSADRNASANAKLCAPMRYRSMPSIAYRMALVAVGEADACVSLASPCAWDLAAGYALISSVGGILVNESGSKIRYAPDGTCDRVSYAFAGFAEQVKHISHKDWSSVFDREASSTPYQLSEPNFGLGKVDAGMLSRAQGCLLGQVAGDSLGSLVEFESAEEILSKYPNSLRLLGNGGPWNTIAGQPTDDSEMALMLARTLITGDGRDYDPTEAFNAYKYWYKTEPADIGVTTSSALSGTSNELSQANGALMRISPLGIFGASFSNKQLVEWAMQDAAVTHPHIICQQVNALFASAIADAVREGTAAKELYNKITQWAKELNVDDTVMTAIEQAKHHKPADYLTSQGWVIIAFQNALYHLLNSNSLESGVVETVMNGGDTDTNGAICGALLGAVYGRDSVPHQWYDRVLSCRAESRPKCFWPVDVLNIAEQLLTVQRKLHV